MELSPENVTFLLRQLANGRQEAASQLIPLIYSELHRRAACCLRRERPGHTLQTTALVHEVYLKLVNQRKAKCQDRADKTISEE